MLIEAGSSKGAMWLYTDVALRLSAIEAPATQDDVSRTLNYLCPAGWQFKDHNGQWGLWPDDALKYHTHALEYLSWIPYMKEVSRAI